MKRRKYSGHGWPEVPRKSERVYRATLETYGEVFREMANSGVSRAVLLENCRRAYRAVAKVKGV